MRKHLDRASGLPADERGNVAVAFALSAAVLVGFSGFAVDLSRAYLARTELQNVADAAALAGVLKDIDSDSLSTADATAKAQLKANLSLKADPTVTASVPASDEIKVAIKAEVPPTLSGIFGATWPINVSATAHRGEMQRKVDISIKNFNSDAWDLNELYVYAIPEDGSTPEEKDMTKVLSNDPDAGLSGDGTITAYVDVDADVGIALHNVTGGMNGYGSNSYGQAQGSSHWFYSEDVPENLSSASAGGKPSYDCSYDVSDVEWTCSYTSHHHTYTSTADVPQDFGDCKTGTVDHYWDDNGGGGDDNDYNDASYSFECTETVQDPEMVRLIS